MRNRPILLLTILLTTTISLLTSSQPATAQGATTIRFAGYTWQVRPAGDGGPGPNHWDPSNVWVDNQGYLHLKLSYVNNEWRCAELYTTEPLGFGRYQFQIIGRVDQFDPNVVLGLFDYPTPAIGPDGTNEIDIEFAHWGNAAYPIGNYTVYPAKPGVDPASHSFAFTLNGDYTTHRFTRTSKAITFQSLHGHTNGNKNEFASWRYAPKDFRKRLPQQALPVHINLWLFQGQAPTNGQPVEVIIRDFSFKAG